MDKKINIVLLMLLFGTLLMSGCLSGDSNRTFIISDVNIADVNACVSGFCPNIVYTDNVQEITGRKTFTDTLVLDGERVTNGAFADASGWTLGGNSSIAGGKGNFLDITGTFTQDIGVEIGNTQVITFTLSALVGGFPPAYVQWTCGGHTGSVRRGNGTYTETFVATTTEPLIFVAGGNFTSASIDNVIAVGYTIDSSGRIKTDYLDVEEKLRVEGTDLANKFNVKDAAGDDIFNINTSTGAVKIGDSDYMTFTPTGGGGLNITSGGFNYITGSDDSTPDKGLGYVGNALAFFTDFYNSNYSGIWNRGVSGTAGPTIWEVANYDTGTPLWGIVLANAGMGSVGGGGMTASKDLWWWIPDGSIQQFANLRRAYGTSLYDLEMVYDASGGNTAASGFSTTAGANTTITNAFYVDTSGAGTITNFADAGGKPLINAGANGQSLTSYGLELPTSNYVRFRDSDLNISSQEDGIIDYGADIGHRFVNDVNISENDLWIDGNFNLKSPNGTWWNCGVDDTGVFSCN